MISSDKFNPGADLLCQRVLGGPQTIRDQPFRKTVWNDVRHLLTQEFVAAISELLFRLEVQQDDLPALIHHHHRVRRRLKHFLEFLLSLVALVRRRLEFVAAAFALCKVLPRGPAHGKNGDHRQHDDESESGEIDKEKPDVGRYGIRCSKRD
jgi:hypothetical protein